VLGVDAVGWNPEADPAPADGLAGRDGYYVDDPEWSGPVDTTAAEQVTHRASAHALGRVLHRPALLPPQGSATVALHPTAIEQGR
jgi:hypothetical protein